MERPTPKVGIELRSVVLEAYSLTTGPTRQGKKRKRKKKTKTKKKKKKKKKKKTTTTMTKIVCLLVGCLTSQQHTSVSQGRICSDNLTCCHTEIEVADQTFHLTQSQYADTGPTSPSTDPTTPDAWQGRHWSASTPKKSRLKRDSKPGSSALEADALTTRPARR